MISTNPVRSRLSIGLALAFAALACFAIHASTAAALSPQQPKSSGHATFTVKAKTLKALKRAGVKVKAIGPAKVKRQGKAAQVKFLVKKYWGSDGKRADVSLKGAIEFKKGKRSFTLGMLNVATHPKRIGIGGSTVPRVGKRSPGMMMTNIFNVKGKRILTSNSKVDRIQIRNGKAALTKGVAKAIRKHLRVKPSLAKAFGKFTLDAKRTSTGPPVDPCIANPTGPGCPVVPVVDPYMAQCDVAATSKVAGTLPVAAPLPTLNGAVDTTGPAQLNWGFKSSFRSYVIHGASGSMHALDGATMNGGPPVPSGFSFPTAPGQYTDNGTESLNDDQAIINGTGAAVFCATGHEFRVVVSNPTVVIDGDNSRIIADVDSNLTGVWTPTQRVDLAKLDPAAVEQISKGTGSAVTWKDIPAGFTKAGADAICGTGEQAACNYTEGTELDPITVVAEIAAPLAADPYLAKCGVAATKKVSGGMAAPAALPSLADAATITSPPSFGWGFKSDFRNYVVFSPPAGSLHALDGAVRLSPSPTAGFNFNFVNGQYAAGDAVDTSDDQAVVNGSGTALFCKPGHGFWVSISNPTIVIDGENSRIVADLSSNESGSWAPVQRTDLADLDLTGITPSYGSGSEVTWGDIPAKLSSSAAPFATYLAGDELDPINVAVTAP